MGKKVRKGKNEGHAEGALAPVVKPMGAGTSNAPSQPPSRTTPTFPVQGKGKRKERRRVPRTAAVVITCPPGQYKDNIRLATEHIDLASLDINGLTARRTVTGAQIFEVGGPDNKRKADALAKRIRQLLADREGVKVTHPIPTAEIRVKDLCDAIEEENVRSAIVSAGGCDPNLVKVRLIRATGRGLGTVWVRCPLTVANKLVTAKRLRVGWTNARIEALEGRPLQCFKCMGKGHVKAQCDSLADRSKDCYRCEKPGHVTRDCASPVSCPVCADLGRPATHRAGSRTCNVPKRKGGQVGQRHTQLAPTFSNKTKEGGANESTPSRKQRGLWIASPSHRGSRV